MGQHTPDSGYVKIPRALLRQEIWRDAGASHLLVYCLLRMTIQPYGDLRPGQFVASKAQMATDMGWSRTTLAQYLNTLESNGMVQTRASNRGTLITILGWEDFMQGHLPPSFCASARSEFERDPDNICTSSYPDSDQPGDQILAPNNNSNKKNTRRDNTTLPDSALLSRPDEDGYRHIWRMYPAHRRCTQAEAYEALDQAVAKGATLEAIERALLAAIRSAAWSKDGGRYVRNLVNWLATEPWQDAEGADKGRGEVGSVSWRY